jgi:hypothetical protein
LYNNGGTTSIKWIQTLISGVVEITQFEINVRVVRYDVFVITDTGKDKVRRFFINLFPLETTSSNLVLTILNKLFQLFALEPSKNGKNLFQFF